MEVLMPAGADNFADFRLVSEQGHIWFYNQPYLLVASSWIPALGSWPEQELASLTEVHDTAKMEQ